MIGVIFEVYPAPGHAQEYLNLAEALKDELIRLDGFISIERFESLSEPGKLLSLSFFRDEQAVQNWRNLPHHRATQARGRRDIFQDYRLRVVSVMRDYGMNEREQAPTDSSIYHGQSQQT